MASARVFVVRPATSNVGNDLIALGLDGLLAARWPGGVEIVSLDAGGPGRGAKPAGLTPRSVHDANLLADAVIAGGGNVVENAALHVDLRALAGLQVPLALLALSSGRVRGRDGRLHLRTDAMPRDHLLALCARADPVVVRDTATLALLHGLGVDDAVVGGCPSTLLGRYATLPPADPSVAGTALLSVRHPELMSVPHAERARVPQDVARLAAHLRRRYDDVALLCHDYRDLAFAASLPDVRALYTEDARELLGWIRGCAVQVGYRLHGFLGAVACGVAAVHVSYDERGAAMVSTLGLEAHDVAMGEVPDVAAAVIGRLDDHGGQLPTDAVERRLDRHDAAMTAAVVGFAARTGRADGVALP